MSDRPNVLWIVLDTLRADALEPYGAPPGSSPVVADLAGRGVALHDVHATASWTLPSHASMLTGVLPRALGLGQAPAETPHSARPALERQRERLFAEVLRRAGYATAGVSANLWVSALSGFDVGFDEFHAAAGTRRAAMDAHTARGRAAWALEALRARCDDGAAQAERVVREWLGRPRERPCFWFVNLNECHSPYLPPRPYHELSPLDRLRAGEEARRHLSLGAIWRACAPGSFDVPDAALARMRRLYRGAVRCVDDWLGRVLEELDRRRLLDDTLVLVTSDHGENFGEGGLMAHAFSLDERLIGVPLVALGPGSGSLAGLRSLAQLPARVAAAIGLDEHPWAPDAGLAAGLPVAQFDPLSAEGDPRLALTAQTWQLGPEVAEMFTTPLTCAVDGRLKLVRRGRDDELIDLEADPLELAPVRGEREIATTAGPALARLRAALDAPSVWAAAGATPGPGSPEEIAEIESRMRLLGYL